MLIDCDWLRFPGSELADIVILSILLSITRTLGQKQNYLLCQEFCLKISFSYGNLASGYDKLRHWNPRFRRAAAGVAIPTLHTLLAHPTLGEPQGFSLGTLTNNKQNDQKKSHWLVCWLGKGGDTQTEVGRMIKKLNKTKQCKNQTVRMSLFTQPMLFKQKSS